MTRTASSWGRDRISWKSGALQTSTLAKETWIPYLLVYTEGCDGERDIRRSWDDWSGVKLLLKLNSPSSRPSPGLYFNHGANVFLLTLQTNSRAHSFQVLYWLVWGSNHGHRELIRERKTSSETAYLHDELVWDKETIDAMSRWLAMSWTSSDGSMTMGCWQWDGGVWERPNQQLIGLGYNRCYFRSMFQIDVQIGVSHWWWCSEMRRLTSAYMHIKCKSLVQSMSSRIAQKMTKKARKTRPGRDLFHMRYKSTRGKKYISLLYP